MTSLWPRHAEGAPVIQASLLAALLALAPVQAWSDEGARPAVEEIVVTAQRREQNLQDVPIAISAFTASDIGRSDLDRFTNIQFQVPGMMVNNSEAAKITIRGVGVDFGTIAAEAGVPVNIDGVYMSRTTIGGSVYADLARIEVLRGPQGTLYGRNATGGTVNFWTKNPTGETDGEASVLYGNAGRFRTRAALGFPILAETLSARLSISTDQHDGYRRDIFRHKDADGRDHSSGRATIRWAPADDLEVLLRANISRDRNRGPLFQYGTRVIPGFSPIDSLGAEGSRDTKHLRHDRPTNSSLRDRVFSATVSWDLHDLPLLGEATAKSVTAYQQHEWIRVDDNDGTEVDWLANDLKEKSKAWTQEVTLASAGDGPLEWVVGAWYYRDRANALFDFELFDFHRDVLGALDGLFFQYVQDTEAWAAFGQATYHVSERLRFTAGLRFSDEEKDYKQTLALGLPAGEGEFSDVFLCKGSRNDADWSLWTPKVSIDYDVTDNVLAYASASRGFKAGGANPGGCNNLYDQELLWAYEVGFKSDWFDNRLRFNVTGFFYDYEDYQANRFINNASAIENASDAEVLGVEVDLKAQPFEGLELNAGLSWQNAEFEDYLSDDSFFGSSRDLKGNQLPKAPDVSWNIGAQYTLPAGDYGFLTLRYEYAWTDSHYFTPFNDPWEHQSRFSMNNARVSFATAGGRLEDSLGDLELHVFVNNLGDKDVWRRNAPSATVGGTVVIFHDPRDYGIELRYRFD